MLIAIENLIDIIVSARVMDSYKHIVKFFEQNDLEYIKLILENLWNLLDYHF